MSTANPIKELEGLHPIGDAGSIDAAIIVMPFSLRACLR